MRDFGQETEKRVRFIKERLRDSGAAGIVFGNSGGKDSALVGILCKRACENTIGVIMPCSSPSNYSSDLNDALLLAEMFEIEMRTVDLTKTAEEIKRAIGIACDITKTADINIAPRLRMTSLYAIAASENRLVAGTGNKCEWHMGYFTKWGDGACDFNPIADLMVSEVYEFLTYLGAPESIISKQPSAGLYTGQTDEGEMGVTYDAIERYLRGGVCSSEDAKIIERYHAVSAHKRALPKFYEGK